MITLNSRKLFLKCRNENFWDRKSKIFSQLKQDIITLIQIEEQSVYIKNCYILYLFTDEN